MFGSRPSNGAILARGVGLLLATCLCFGLDGCAGGSGGSSGQNPGNEAPPAPASAAVTLSWGSPSVSADGTTLTDLAGFKVYDGSSFGNYTMVTDVGSLTEFTTDPLPAGTYYFSVTAYDTSGNESDFSNQVVATVTGDQSTQVLAMGN